MATRPKIGLVDELIDEASLVGTDLHRSSCDARNRLHTCLHDLVRVWNELVVIETATKPADDKGEGGGDLYLALTALREAPAIRRANARQQVAA